ncbi:MAG: hypothetical protein R6U69_01530 [Marinobacter sp.]
MTEVSVQADICLYSAKEDGRNRIAPRVRTTSAEQAAPDASA